MKRLMLTLFTISSLLLISQNNSTWSLNDCINYAIENNITVKKAELNKSSAEINYNQSRNNRLPGVNASASQGFSHGSTIDPITDRFVDKNVHSTSINGNVGIDLYNGGKINKQIRQNKIFLNQNDFFVQQARNNIMISITQAFIQTLYYKESIKISFNTYESTKKELEQAQIKYKEGAIAKKDLVDMESQFANDKYQVLLARNNYNQQIFKLKQILELDPEVKFALNTPSIDGYNITMPSKSEIFRSALRSLPDVKSKELQKQINEEDIAIAKSSYYPSLSLSGGLRTGYSNVQDPSFSKQLDHNFEQFANLSLNIPIFNKLQTKNSVEIAKINVAQAELDIIQANKDLYNEIENTWINYHSNASEEDALKASRDAAKIAYDMALIKYNNGALTATDLLVSKNSYLIAEQQYLQTRYMVVLYYQLLQYYQGKPIKL